MKVRLIVTLIIFLYFKESKETDIKNYIDLSYYALNNKNLSGQGPYKVNWITFETCKGIKRTDCGNIRLENQQDMSNLLFVLDFPKDCPITKGKVNAGSVQSKNRAAKKLWNYNLDSPCEHFVLGPILLDAFNLTRTCKIKKGHYEIYLNMDETCLKFLGRTFFYGKYLFKMMAYNNINNFFCFNTEFEVAKL